ncbi:MAG: DUF3142 domain-containing protein [Novosphingobium sp.]|uniref:DUF3142 domain-containing protein n=1 Tax=Novosphingobium sp. TaxID=1874826 RepID=UPI0027368995|nr:DUF3142 domain-containing protein [Novosphingobium sp.]MDP3550546.1 DUF3142 domain-containing protein [Novosphingobium sp.]
MKRRAAVALALSLLTGCEAEPQPTTPPAVQAAKYDAIYVWPGVRPAAGSAAKTVYLLDGEVRREGAARLERLRMGVPKLPGRTVWLVVRAERLDWNEATYAAILADLARWEDAGNAVAGLQVDFDAATRGIEGYARFLQGLRERLPGRWKLSITGLMDWSAHGDPQALAGLAETIDEVVVQTYQARTTIPGYEQYFARMERFPIPFRVALVEGGAWQAPPMLAHHPMFRGYVVFLLGPTKPKT